MEQLWVHCEHGASGPVCVFNNVGCVGGYEATPSEVLAAVATLDGAQVIERGDGYAAAWPVSGGPPARQGDDR